MRDNCCPNRGKTSAGVSVAAARFIRGRDVELHRNETHIQWRYKGETEWIDLVALADLRPELLQTLGDRTDAAVSQAAVTEALARKMDRDAVTAALVEVLQEANAYTDEAIAVIPIPDVSAQIEVHDTSPAAHPDIRDLIAACTGLPEWDPVRYALTFVTQNGARLVVDLPLESIDLDYDPETQDMIYTNASGVKHRIPLSAFVDIYVGSLGEEIQVDVAGGNIIEARLLDGTVGWSKLSAALRNMLEGKADVSYVNEQTAAVADRIPAVVQQAGDSETSVMSQKSVTEAFAAVNEVLYTQYTVVSLSRTPAIIEKGVPTPITLAWSTKFNGADLVPDSLALLRGEETLAEDPRSKGFVDTVSDAATWTLMVVVKGIEKRVSASVTACYPMYFGGSSGERLETGEEVLALTKQAIKASPAGAVSVYVGADEYLWLCVPDSMTINSVTSGGFAVTMNLPVPVDVAGKGLYKCYRSAQRFNAGQFDGIVY